MQPIISQVGFIQKNYINIDALNTKSLYRYSVENILLKVIIANYFNTSYFLHGQYLINQDFFQSYDYVCNNATKTKSMFRITL